MSDKIYSYPNASITVRIENLPEIEAAFKKLPTAVAVRTQNALEKILYKIEGTAKKLAPVNKQSGGGNLRQSIRAQMTGPLSGKVEVGAEYGIFVHEGTRPHTIEVVNRRALANKRTGQFFGRKVNHPGTKANPFLQLAVIAEDGYINDQMEAITKDII
jgi:HK97 gp10 family phage protein